jgi:DNA-binding NtrC family response regulator
VSLAQPAETAVPSKPYLLALDGDDTVLRMIAETAAPHFQVLTTRDPRKLLAWLENYRRIDVIATEHVLQTSHGVALLESARVMRPEARRVLLTTYHDLPSIVAGLHSGAIQHLVQKPFNWLELLTAILPEGAAVPGANQQRASA